LGKTTLARIVARERGVIRPPHLKRTPRGRMLSRHAYRRGLAEPRREPDPVAGWVPALFRRGSSRTASGRVGGLNGRVVRPARRDNGQVERGAAPRDRAQEPVAGQKLFRLEGA
jgi:hypothetical protein